MSHKNNPFGDIEIENLREHMEKATNSEYHAWMGAVFVQKRSVEVMKVVITQLRQGRPFDMTMVLSLVNDFVNSCKNNEDHFINLARIKDANNYQYSHPVNVCIYSIAIGCRLKYNDKQLLRLGTAALLHDIGEVKLPERMIQKSAKYTESEILAMQKHPELGYELLKKDSSVPEDVLLGVLHHHERLDGSGYPAGHVGRFIHPLGKIIAVAETFDALTSPRYGAEGMTPTEALKKLYSLAGKHYELNVVKALVMLLGMYPMGSIVRLNGGQLAVVVSKNKADLTKPIVLVVTDANSQPIEPYEVDLYGDKSGRTIVRAENPNHINIDANKYLQEYMASRNN